MSFFSRESGRADKFQVLGSKTLDSDRKKNAPSVKPTTFACDTLPNSISDRHVLKRCQIGRGKKGRRSRGQRHVALSLSGIWDGALRGGCRGGVGSPAESQSRGGREGLRLQGCGLPHPVVELEVAVHQAELELGLVDGRLRGGAWRVVGGALVRWYVVSGW